MTSVAAVYREPATVTQLRPATIAVVAGRPRAAGQPLNQPPVFASAFGSGDGAGYARRTNPTWEAFEDALGALEGGSAVAFASGMAAVATALDTLCDRRVAVGSSAYIEVRSLLDERQTRGALSIEQVDPLDTPAMIEAIDRCDLIWLDAISNPGLDVPDLDLILEAARRSGTNSVVDSTLATPILLRPLELGADLVLHSATKYIGGHSDLMLGALVAGDPRLAERLRARRNVTGSVPGTMEAWLGLRGMRTLALRMERGAATAAQLADRLTSHHCVSAVRYPGLASDPAHRSASRLFDGPGAVISFEVDGAAHADAVCAEVEVISHASSLGGVETLIERQARWHAEPAVGEGLLRLSVGCEDPTDLWRDLDRALSVCA